MAGVLVTGETWIRVPETIRVDASGRLAPGVCAKDVMLALCARLGMDGGDYQVIQYTGSLIADLPMQERMTLCNMATELGAQTGLIAPDGTTAGFILGAGGGTIDPAEWQGDDDAGYRETLAFDADTLPPQVALPHSPANAGPVDAVGGERIDLAYIGSCTGAKLADLRMAADVLKGRQVANGVRLLVAPASRRETATAAAEGTLATLIEAGAVMMPSGCGACAGYGFGVLAENEICISSTARNSRGRMGARSAQVYLASPYTVAASAVAGRISDPREFVSRAR
jgi:3-isopropylmalate/(R)-2-methylmalate dehydratase large subunit